MFYNLLLIPLVMLHVLEVLSESGDTTTKKPKYTLCTRDEECTLNAYCHLGRCTCKTGFIPYRESPKSPNQCIKEASAIEDYCEKDVQCQAALGKHSHCRRLDPAHVIGKCYCNEDSHFAHNICYRTSYIGQICEVNDNCFIKSRNLVAYCDHSRCICPPNHHPVDGGTDCHPYSGLGGPCFNDEACITPNSECEGGVCKCRREYIHNKSNHSCLQVAKRLGDSCDEDEQCSVVHQFVMCDNTTNVCVCEKGAHMADGTCWRTAALKEPCGSSYECKWDPTRHHGVDCTDGICQCRPGYTMENKECVFWDPVTKGKGSREAAQYCSVLLLISFMLFYAI